VPAEKTEIMMVYSSFSIIRLKGVVVLLVNLELLLNQALSPNRFKDYAPTMVSGGRKKKKSACCYCVHAFVRRLIDAAMIQGRREFLSTMAII